MNSIGGSDRAGPVPRVSEGAGPDALEFEWHTGGGLSQEMQGEVVNFFSSQITEDAWNQRFSAPYGENGFAAAMKSFDSVTCHLLVARDAQGVCIGLLDMQAAHETKDSAQLGLIVASKNQRRGCGSSMVRQAIEHGRCKGFKELVIDAQGKGAAMLAQKLGFMRDFGESSRYVYKLCDMDDPCIVY